MIRILVKLSSFNPNDMIRILFSLLFFTLSTIAGVAVQGQQTAVSPDKARQIDAFMMHAAENGLFNGAILVAEHGEVIYRKSFGYADFENSVPLAPETAFYLASVSKQFTTMAVMMLKEEGKLSYTDPLSKYFPAFPAYARGVTIRHLMTHTSGIPDHYRLGAYKPDLTNRDVYELLVKQDSLDFRPGDMYRYSNGGYVLLAMIVEKASGKPFYEFMKEKIFDPLDMDRTLVYDASKPVIKNRAIGYNQSGMKDDYEILTTGAGGMFSTVDDLFKWDRALYTDKLVSQKTLEEAYTPTALNDGEISNYGYGWGVVMADGKKTVSHGGSLNGFRTYIGRNLEDQNTLIFLTNNGGAVANQEIREGIANILEGKPYDMPAIPIAAELNRLLMDHAPKNAVKKAKKRLKDHPGKYKKDEGNINSLGYYFLGRKEYDKAIAVFGFNIDLFPDAPNVYDSMGEACMVSGDTAKAISYYRKSVELDPVNQNGLNMLASMGVDTSGLVKPVIVPVDVLEKYTGVYELAPGFNFTITLDGDQLMVEPTGQMVSPIYPASEVRFYSRLVDAQITFRMDKKGNVTGLTLHQGGNTEARKVK